MLECCDTPGVYAGYALGCVLDGVDTGGFALWGCGGSRTVGLAARVSRCVLREGGLSRGVCCGCGVSRVSDVVRRRVSVLSMCMPMFMSMCACHLYVIYPGRSAVSDPHEARPWPGYCSAHAVWLYDALGGHMGRSEARAAVSSSLGLSEYVYVYVYVQSRKLGK